MITILVGIIIFVYLYKNSYRFDEGLIAGGIVVGIVLTICGILVPMDGFSEPVVVEKTLMPLRLDQETDETYYLKKSNGNYVYAYDNSERYGLSGCAYEQDSIGASYSTKVYESEECTTPILKIFTTKSKISWYSVAGMWKNEEYVFYVPMGTKLEENKK